MALRMPVWMDDQYSGGQPDYVAAGMGAVTKRVDAQSNVTPNSYAIPPLVEPVPSNSSLGVLIAGAALGKFCILNEEGDPGGSNFQAFYDTPSTYNSTANNEKKARYLYLKNHGCNINLSYGVPGGNINAGNAYPTFVNTVNLAVTLTAAGLWADAGGVVPQVYLDADGLAWFDQRLLWMQLVGAPINKPIYIYMCPVIQAGHYNVFCSDSDWRYMIQAVRRDYLLGKNDGIVLYVGWGGSATQPGQGGASEGSQPWVAGDTTWYASLLEELDDAPEPNLSALMRRRRRRTNG